MRRLALLAGLLLVDPAGALGAAGDGSSSFDGGSGGGRGGGSDADGGSLFVYLIIVVLVIGAATSATVIQQHRRRRRDARHVERAAAAAAQTDPAFSVDAVQAQTARLHAAIAAARATGDHEALRRLCGDELFARWYGVAPDASPELVGVRYLGLTDDRVLVQLDFAGRGGEVWTLGRHDGGWRLLSVARAD